MRSTNKLFGRKRKQSVTIVTAYTLFSAIAFPFISLKLKKPSRQIEIAQLKQTIVDLRSEVEQVSKEKAQEQIEIAQLKQTIVDLRSEVEKKSEAEKERERRAIFLTAALVAVVTIFSAPGQFALLGSVVGIILILVLLIYCKPNIEEGWLWLVFSAVFALCFILVCGILLNGSFPTGDNPCPIPATSSSSKLCKYFLVPFFNSQAETNQGDIIEFIIWVVVTFIVFLSWLIIKYISDKKKTTQKNIQP